MRNTKNMKKTFTIWGLAIALICALRWVTRADAADLEIAPLAREYFLVDRPVR